MSWPTVQLGDAYWFQEGPGIRNWQFKNSGIKLLNVGNIEKVGRINLAKTDRHISLDEAYGKYKHFLCDEGDLVIASSGISIDDDGYLRTRGCFIEKQHLPLCINTSTIRFKSLGNNDLSYLKHWLQSVEFRRQITKLVTGSAQLNFGPSHLKQLKISIPPLAEQQRIAEILDKAAAIKAKREQAITKLDELAQSALNEIYDCSEEFAELSIKDLMKKSSPIPAEKSKVWSLSLEQIESNSGKIIEKIEVKPSKLGTSTYYFEPPVVLYSKLRPYLNKVASPDSEGYATTELVPLYCDQNKVLPSFMATYLRSKKFVEFANTNSAGAKMPRVMMDKFWSHKVALPPLDKQKKFELLFERCNELRLTHESSLLNFEKFIASLQHQAFTTGFAA